MPHPEASLPIDLAGLIVLVTGFPLALLLAPRGLIATVIVATAYVVRGVAALTNHFLVPAYAFDPDWHYLDGVAVRIAEGGLAAWPSSIETGREFYAWLAALPYLLLGRTPFFLVAVNVFLGTVLVVAVFHLAKALGAGLRARLLAAAVAAVFPTLVAYCVQPSREPLITLAFTLGVLGLVRWMRHRSVPDLVLAGVGLLLAGLIHSSFVLALLLASAFVVVEQLARSRKHLSPFALSLLLVVVGLAAAGSIVATGVGLGKLGFDLTSAGSLDVIERVTDKGDVDARAAYVSPDDIEIDGYGDVARKLPARVALFLLKPFPTDVRGIADLIGVVVSATAVAGVVAFAAAGRKRRRTRTWWLLALLLSTQLLMYAWGTVNFGSATRHKSKFVPLLLAIVAAEAAAPRRRTVFGPRPGGVGADTHAPGLPREGAST